MFSLIQVKESFDQILFHKIKGAKNRIHFFITMDIDTHKKKWVTSIEDYPLHQMKLVSDSNLF